MDIVVGIDPGAGGAIAYSIGDSLKPLVRKMPDSRSALFDFFKEFKSDGKRGLETKCKFITEKAMIFPGDGKVSAAKFMLQYERILCAMEFNELKYTEIHPTKWQNDLNLRRKKVKGEPKETKQERKNRYKEFAQRLFPHLKITLQTADALLIWYWAKTVK